MLFVRQYLNDVNFPQKIPYYGNVEMKSEGSIFKTKKEKCLVVIVMTWNQCMRSFNDYRSVFEIFGIVLRSSRSNIGFVAEMCHYFNEKRLT